MKPVILNEQQTAMLGELEKHCQSFRENESQIGSEAAISIARSVVARAADLKMPQVAMTELQIYINLFDTDKALPEHLRSLGRA